MLLTEKDVAALLACTPHTVRRLPIKKVYLHSDRKRKARYTQEAVNAYLRSIGALPGSPVPRPGRRRPPSAGGEKKQSASQHWSEIPIENGKQKPLKRQRAKMREDIPDYRNWREWTPPKVE